MRVFVLANTLTCFTASIPYNIPFAEDIYMSQSDGVDAFDLKHVIIIAKPLFSFCGFISDTEPSAELDHSLTLLNPLPRPVCCCCW
jgi:hypothetical protein